MRISADSDGFCRAKFFEKSSENFKKLIFLRDSEKVETVAIGRDLGKLAEIWLSFLVF